MSGVSFRPQSVGPIDERWRAGDTLHGMSVDPHVELVRRAFEAVFRQPRPDFDTVNALFSADHVYVSPTTELEGRTWHGGSGFRDFLSAWDETMDWTGEVTSARALDELRVLVEGTLVTRGKGNGVEMAHRRA